MRMPTVILPELLDEIAMIGEQRRPLEACGVLLPFPHLGRMVWEMPNRSMKPEEHFVMEGSDILLSLESWDASPEDWLDLTIWHTHPNSSLGPSQGDLDNRKEQLGNLVITLYEDAPAKATWY